MRLQCVNEERNDPTSCRHQIRQFWSDSFELELRVNVSKRLTLALSMRNLAERSLTFSAALHTYFAISDVSGVKVDGLQGCRYLDTVVLGVTIGVS